MSIQLGKPYEKHIPRLDIYECYKKSPYLSVKHSSYFHVYAELLDTYRNKPITFIEIGVLGGGSLFMWREYLGHRARIIGIDLNPLAKRWEEHGFEIYIGSQSEGKFWDELFNSVGDVDVVLDDGGHTYEQQIVTASKCIPHIKNGGLLIVEDTHTSYFQDFGYPCKYSFIEWAKGLIDNINCRFPSVQVSSLPYKSSVYSISIFQSIACFKIHRELCVDSSPTSNDGILLNSEDFKYLTYKGSKIEEANSLISLVKRLLPFVRHFPFLRNIANWYRDIVKRRELKRLKRYF